MTKNDQNSIHPTVLPGATIVLMLAILLLLPACYTILKHPAVIQDDYTRADTHQCGDCHYDDDIWQFHHPHSPYRPGYGYRNPWSYYYDVPWWYDAYWFYDNDRDPETAPLHQRSLRPSDMKDPSSGASGGAILPPGSIRSGGAPGTTKVKAKDDAKNDTGTSKTTDKKRTVRPSKKKKKKDN